MLDQRDGTHWVHERCPAVVHALSWWKPWKLDAGTAGKWVIQREITAWWHEIWASIRYKDRLSGYRDPYFRIYGNIWIWSDIKTAVRVRINLPRWCRLCNEFNGKTLSASWHVPQLASDTISGIFIIIMLIINSITWLKIKLKYHTKYRNYEIHIQSFHIRHPKNSVLCALLWFGGGGFYQYLYSIGTRGTKIDASSILTFMFWIVKKGVGKYICTKWVSFIDIDMMSVGGFHRRGRREPFNDNISDVDLFFATMPNEERSYWLRNVA